MKPVPLHLGVSFVFGGFKSGDFVFMPLARHWRFLGWVGP